MSKIILKVEDDKVYFDFSKIENPVEAVHILTTALVHLVKEYETANDKKDFLRIMEIYYDDTK